MADREIREEDYEMIDDLDAFEDMDFEEEVYSLDEIDPRLLNPNNCD